MSKGPTKAELVEQLEEARSLAYRLKEDLDKAQRQVVAFADSARTWERRFDRLLNTIKRKA